MKFGRLRKSKQIYLKIYFGRFTVKHSLVLHSQAPAKRSEHANATCRSIVGRNMLSAFGHRVAMCCDMLGVVGSNLSQQHPTCRNTSQHGGQTHATCCAKQCCDMLRWHVAIVWPGLHISFELVKRNI